jgi:hypothetical protein
MSQPAHALSPNAQGPAPRGPPVPGRLARLGVSRCVLFTHLATPLSTTAAVAVHLSKVVAVPNHWTVMRGLRLDRSFRLVESSSDEVLDV